jgi:uncharacterized protein (TIGR02145 family)
MLLKVRIVLYFIVIASVFALIFPSSCKKEEEKVMKVRNDSVSSVSIQTAKAHATIIDIGQGLSQHGHCWSTDDVPDVNDNKSEKGSKTVTGSYISNLTDLLPNTKYYVRAYIQNSGTTVYGSEILSFTTLSAGLPEVTTGEVTNITTHSAIVSGSLDDPGTGATSVSEHGHCWSSVTTTPIIEGNEHKTTLGTRDTTGTFESNIGPLTQGTLYYVRAYATNTSGTSYGDTISFTTVQAGSVPSVTTADVSSITTNSAICGGNVTSEGSSAVTARGVCWNTTGAPTIFNDITSDGSGTGSYTSNITGLTASTAYFVRAYATNDNGTGYGDQESFTTSAGSGLPTVTTASVSSITTNSAICGGNVTSDGGSAVTGRGVCWNTSGSPEISDNLTTDGSGTGPFTSNITDLAESTTYYVRAYATNSNGTSYGNEEDFTTTDVAELPTVETTSIAELFVDGATITGNVTSDGGAEVTDRGVCWVEYGTTPTISDNTVSGGSGTGIFSCNITGLESNITYSVRAYATNSVGTNYGTQMNFLTLSDDPNAEWVPGEEWIDTRDEHAYGTMQIGDQVWMTDNLNHGKRIDGIYHSEKNGYVEKYCYDDDEFNCDYYGGLYQWDEMMQYSTYESSQGICPSGWHIPSDNEWKQLEMYMGMSETSADSTNVWRGTYEAFYLYEAGFISTFPGMCYYTDGEFYYAGDYIYIWSSTQYGDDFAYERVMGTYYSNIWRSAFYKTNGYSVRCVKD